MADRMAIMNHGKVGADRAHSHEVYDRPSNSFVARFLGEANMFRRDDQAGACGQSRLRHEEGLVLLARRRVGRRGLRSAREHHDRDARRRARELLPRPYR